MDIQKMFWTSKFGRPKDMHKVSFAITRTTLSRLVSWEGLAMNPRATFFVDAHDKGLAARFEVADGKAPNDAEKLEK